MPIVETISPGRIEFRGSLSAADVKTLADDRKLEVLQTCSPADPATWDRLNDGLFSTRANVTLRVYGFICSNWDLSFVQRLSNLRRFAADCLQKAHGIECVSSLHQLQELSIGIYSLDSFGFLENLPSAHLRALSLHATKSKKPDLAPLERFGQLRRVYLEGQQRNIEALSQLRLLEELTLRSITVGGLDFLRGLEQLWSIDLKLGGTNNLSALDGWKQVKYLELWQIRGLSDLSVISTLVRLQFLFLQSLPQVSSLPDLQKLKKLRRLYLENMKGLTNVDAVATAPALEEFLHVSAVGLQPSQYAALLKSNTLKGIHVGFGSRAKNEALRAMAAKAGVPTGVRSEFCFK